MRTFVALNLPEGERERIHCGTRALRAAGMPVRWVDVHQLHITLKFLGEIRPERVREVQEAVAKAASATPPLTLVLRGFGVFPSLHRPRVIWMGVEDAPELRALKAALEETLGGCGFEADPRAFHPHLTLGRAASPNATGAWRDLERLLVGMELAAQVEIPTVDLMQSHLSPKGARYSVVSAARLGGS